MMTAQKRNAELIRLLKPEFLSTGPGGTTMVSQTLFTMEGNLSTGAKPLRIYNKTGGNKTITQVFVCVNTAPTGQSIIVDVHKDGVTIFTDQAHRPIIAPGANSGTTITIDIPTWADGEYLQIGIDLVGSIVVGADLTVHVVHN